MKLKNVFVVLVVLALCVVGVGFYQGWFVLSNPDSGEGSNKVNVKLTMDPDKAKADAEAVKAKARSLTGNAAEKTPAKSSDDGAKSKIK
jgi:hypothetical protein